MAGEGWGGANVARSSKAGDHPDSAAFTAALALEKSILPVYFALRTATTLPMSLMELAPTSAIAALMASAAASASQSCCGQG